MGNHRLLSKIFENAERVSITNKDKLVFFSDVHRGNNSWADDFARNEMVYIHALQHYYRKGYTYVEVGDGDELLKFKYIKPIREAHEQVYRILQKFHKAKRLYYIFGNHDIEYKHPELVHRKLNRIFDRATEKEELLFDDFTAHEGLVFSHKESGFELFAVHGHQGDDLFHRFIWLNRILLRALWRPLQLLGLQDPTSVANNPYKREKVERELMKWCETHQQPMLCGHTHDARFPRKGKTPYFNDGSCVHPRWITCMEIENGEIALVRWRIKVGKKGELFVKRNIEKGPRPLAHFIPADQ